MKCVDCMMALIGERVRCPACHARHAERLSLTDVPVSMHLPARKWRHAIETIGVVVVLGLAIAVKGCLS